MFNSDATSQLPAALWKDELRKIIVSNFPDWNLMTVTRTVSVEEQLL